jgi:hypothetical protein
MNAQEPSLSEAVSYPSSDINQKNQGNAMVPGVSGVQTIHMREGMALLHTHGP